jgi:hypothetical protein
MNDADSASRAGFDNFWDRKDNKEILLEILWQTLSAGEREKYAGVKKIERKESPFGTGF